MSVECIRCHNVVFEAAPQCVITRYQLAIEKVVRDTSGKRFMQCKTCGQIYIALSSKDEDNVKWIVMDETPRRVGN